MIIDKNPTKDELNNTLTVSYNIDEEEDVWISINGIMTLFDEDLIKSIDDTVFLKTDLDINYDDEFVVFYSRRFL